MTDIVEVELVGFADETYVMLEVASRICTFRPRAYHFIERRYSVGYLRLREEFVVAYERNQRLMNYTDGDPLVMIDFLQTYSRRFIDAFGEESVPRDVRFILHRVCENLNNRFPYAYPEFDFGPLGGYEVTDDIIEHFVYDHLILSPLYTRCWAYYPNDSWIAR